MSVNISDSMSAAVENASVVLVVVSKGYKESGNCRKEVGWGRGERLLVDCDEITTRLID